MEHIDKQPSPKPDALLEDSTIGYKNSGKLETKNKFVGTSTALEKSYMRLTTAPKASDVRPLAVLRKALSHVKAHFIENEDFNFANEQLKSKLDLTSIIYAEVSNDSILCVSSYTMTY